MAHTTDNGRLERVGTGYPDHGSARPRSVLTEFFVVRKHGLTITVRADMTKLKCDLIGHISPISKTCVFQLLP